MKIKIVNGKKFVKNCSIIFGLILLTLICINNISFSYSQTKYSELYISGGDTLWSIAAEEKESNSYFKSKDIRDIINIIKQTNHLNTSDLKVGQKLNIPTL